MPSTERRSSTAGTTSTRTATAAAHFARHLDHRAEPLPERRSRVRHAASVLIEVSAPGEPHRRRALRNVGHDGLSFSTTHPMRPGTTISIRIRASDSPILLVARVAWSQLADQGWEVGVHYVGGDDAFRARIVDEVCELQTSRNRTRAERTHKLAARRASAWMTKHSAAQSASTAEH